MFENGEAEVLANWPIQGPANWRALVRRHGKNGVCFLFWCRVHMLEMANVRMEFLTYAHTLYLTSQSPPLMMTEESNVVYIDDGKVDLYKSPQNTQGYVRIGDIQTDISITCQ